MNPKIPIAAITDEFSPDLEVALRVMKEIGMTAAELRVVSGKNIMDLSDAELDRAKEITDRDGFQGDFNRIALAQMRASQFSGSG